MKKVVSLFLCFVMVLGIMTSVPVTATAGSNSKWKVFDSETSLLWRTMYFWSSLDYNEPFSISTIKIYTARKMDIDDYYVGRIEIDEGDGSYYENLYSIPADIYEAEVQKYFNINNMEEFRNDKWCNIPVPVYNYETNTYDTIWSDYSGVGDSVGYCAGGYRYIGNSKYEMFGYQVENDYYKPQNAVLSVDYVINGNHPAEIEERLKFTIEFNGTNVKFLSCETVSLDDFPTENELIGKDDPESPKTPKLKTIANNRSGVKLTWGKVKDADSYVIYRKIKGGSYSKVGKTSKTYFIDKKAKSGKRFYYVVKAVNEAGESFNSKALSIKYLADPTLKAPVSKKSGITLKWSKVTGAQGYIIYRKTGNGSYTKLKTEKGVSNLFYIDKSAKKGKKYTYKVKAYYGKTYSAYSNTKTIKDKY